MQVPHPTHLRRRTEQHLRGSVFGGFLTLSVKSPSIQQVRWLYWRCFAKKAGWYEKIIYCRITCAFISQPGLCRRSWTRPRRWLGWLDSATDHRRCYRLWVSSAAIRVPACTVSILVSTGTIPIHLSNRASNTSCPECCAGDERVLLLRGCERVLPLCAFVSGWMEKGVGHTKPIKPAQVGRHAV